MGFISFYLFCGLKYEGGAAQHQRHPNKKKRFSIEFVFKL